MLKIEREELYLSSESLPLYSRIIEQLLNPSKETLPPMSEIWKFRKAFENLYGGFLSNSRMTFDEFKMRREELIRSFLGLEAVREMDWQCFCQFTEGAKQIASRSEEIIERFCDLFEHEDNHRSDILAVGQAMLEEGKLKGAPEITVTLYLGRLDESPDFLGFMTTVRVGNIRGITTSDKSLLVEFDTRVAEKSRERSDLSEFDQSLLIAFNHDVPMIDIDIPDDLLDIPDVQ